MAFEGLEINSVTETHLAALIGLPESRDLDFKLETYGNADRDKKEFLADVSSFANTIGGHIVIGVSEAEGIATAITGVDVDSDQEIQRLESIALSGLQPRIVGLQIAVVALGSGKRVLIVHVPRSWNGPHRVIAQSSNRFYLRAGSQKYEPDVDELRKLFTGDIELSQRIRDFHFDRVGKISAQAAPLPLLDKTALVLHIIPFSAFTANKRIELDQILLHKASFFPMRAQNTNWRINLDGFLTYTSETPTAAYTQIWKNGCIEAVRSPLVRRRTDGQIPQEGEEKGFGLPAIAAQLISGCKNYLTGLKALGVSPPFSLFVSLVGVRGAKLFITRDYFDHEDAFDRDLVFVPELIVDEYPSRDEEVPALMHPIFTDICNASGIEASPSFNLDGSIQRE